jgi:putative transposase
MHDLPFSQRRAIRLPGRDYSADGAYFVTVCTIERGAVLGDVFNGTLYLNAAGDIVADAWRWLPTRYPYVTLDEWCVMSDHLHGILVIGGSRAAHQGAVVETHSDITVLRRKPLGELIGAFKTVSTKHVNLVRNTPGAALWQRDFWDHVVRDDADLHRIRAYIRDNRGCRGGS